MPVAYQPVFAFYVQPVLLPWVVLFEVNVLDVHSVLLGRLHHPGPEGHSLVCLCASIPDGDHLTGRSEHAVLHLGIHIKLLSFHHPGLGSCSCPALLVDARRGPRNLFSEGEKRPERTCRGVLRARHQHRDVLDRPAGPRLRSSARGKHQQRRAGATDAEERAAYGMADRVISDLSGNSSARKAHRLRAGGQGVLDGAGRAARLACVSGPHALGLPSRPPCPHSLGCARR